MRTGMTREGADLSWFTIDAVKLAHMHFENRPRFIFFATQRIGVLMHAGDLVLEKLLLKKQYKGWPTIA